MSKAATARVLKREAHRPRYDERKTQRRKARHGQVESLRRPGRGVGAAVFGGYGPNVIADAAMVQRAAERF